MAAIASTMGLHGVIRKVVTSAGFQNGFVAMGVDCRLFHQYRSYRLEGYAEINILSVADTSLNTSRALVRKAILSSSR